MAQMKHMLVGVAYLLPVLAAATVHAQSAGSLNAPVGPLTCRGPVSAATSNVADDPNIAPKVRDFLVKIDKSPAPFWTYPQPKPQDILTALQNETPVDMSGVTTTERSITVDGHETTLYIMKPDHIAGHPGVIRFIHGGVWIVGNFANHERLLRDIVVESGQPAVFVEYTSLPAAKYPVQMDQSYAALEWTTKHAAEAGSRGLLDIRLTPTTARPDPAPAWRLIRGSPLSWRSMWPPSRLARVQGPARHPTG
jgi:acetyl esterase